MVESNVTTIELTGSEQEVQFNVAYSYFWCNNLGDADVLMSMKSSVASGADGVIIVPAGAAAGTMHGYTKDTVYVSGIGTVQVMGTYSAHNPFKLATKGGGGASDGSYVPLSGGTMEGALVAQNNTEYTVAQVRNVTMSTEAASGGSNGQIHFQYS